MIADYNNEMFTYIGKVAKLTSAIIRDICEPGLTLVPTIKRCQNLLIQVHNKLISIHLCKFLMIVRGVTHLVHTHEGEKGLSKFVDHTYKVGGRGVDTSKCVN